MADPYLPMIFGLLGIPRSKSYSPAELSGLEAEYELIQKKKSTRSATSRKRTVRIWEGILKRREPNNE